MSSSSAPATAEIRHCAVLIVDVADTVSLRSRLGDSAAGRRIRHLLEAIIASARQYGGDFIKSYGDDVMAVFESDAVASAARTAIAAQEQARDAGLQLYAGLHAGPVEFCSTMGHPDVVGLTVDLASRLHKLTSGAPGRIYLAEECLADLPTDLLERTSRYGMRDIKGIGEINVWVLDWQGKASTGIAFAYEVPGTTAQPLLVLDHGGRQLRTCGESRTFLVGRGKDCELCIPDPEPRVSTTHLQFEQSAGRWFVQDISRNGTWMRDHSNGEELSLPSCRQVMLPRAGALCLGRPFSRDPEALYTIAFTIAGTDPAALPGS